jgi:hypothetical protein
MTALSNPTSDSATESCDEDDESCWRRCCGVMLAMTMPGQPDHDVK